jgi:hypothetical protein
MWISGMLIVGTLLAVVIGDAMIAEGQVRLSAAQHEVAGAIATQKALQVAVAQKAAPPVVVKQAKSQGMVAPTQVVYLPRVRLDVPLPAPQTTPPPASPPPASSTPRSASSPAAAGSAALAASSATTTPAKR